MRGNVRWAVGLVVALWVTPLLAIEPREVLVIYNKNLPESLALAQYYCEKRQVPKENLLPLDVADVDEISRPDYDQKIKSPIRFALRNRFPNVRVLLNVYGVPLRVGGATMTDADKANLEATQKEQGKLLLELEAKAKQLKLLEADFADEKDPAFRELVEPRRKEVQQMQQRSADLDARKLNLQHTESIASVESELMLVQWDDYPLARWVINPLYHQIPEQGRQQVPPVLMTCRLDAPTPAIVRRMIDDAIATEKLGLQGDCYIDARNLPWDKVADKSGTAYGGYDESMRETALILQQDAKLKVTLDNQPELFLPGSCKNCAIYCGWYSVQNYVDCCRFNKGAVAWHLASFEAVCLRNPQKQWCGNLLRDGACVTLGPVAEPYTVGFPKPAEFFTFVASGEMPMVECFAKSTLFASWMVTLIGDPLYTPYKVNPRLKASSVVPSPKGSRIFGP